MFNLFKKTEVNSVDVYSICKGKIVPIENVPDITFAQKLLGDGIAFTYEGDTLYSPCDAEVIFVAPTKHAIGLKLKNGAEILIHTGLETVNYHGKGLTPLVKKGQKVKKAKPILKIDREFMTKNNINMITPFVITNQNDYRINIQKINQNVSLPDIVLTITKK